MARPWRIEFPGAIYHVMARGNRRQKIFEDDQDRQIFLELVGRCAGRYEVEIIAFCLMPNHYHLFLRTPRGNLSRAMKWLGGVYTQRYNHRHRRDGHLFKGRYRAVLVEDEGHWFHLSAYIHLNPRRAGLTADPADWEWSSFRDYTRSRARFGWLRPEVVLAAYGDAATRRRNYRRAVLALAGAKPSVWEELRNAVFIGTEERWEELRQSHAPSGQRQWVPEHRVTPSRPVDFIYEIERVARTFGVSAKEIRSGRRGYLRPACYYHLVVNCGLRGQEAAELFGVSAMAVSSGLLRLNAAQARDPILAAKIKTLTFNV